MLENEETQEQLTLVKEKITISPESVANFVYAWGGSAGDSRSKKIRNFH